MLQAARIYFGLPRQYARRQHTTGRSRPDPGKRKVDDTAAPVLPSGSGHRDIRRNNLEVVLRHLSLLGPDSRAAIATRSGLTRSTVSRLVGELMELGLVGETGPDPGHGIGRPATRLELDGRHVLAVGAEINVDYLAVLVTDLAGREIYEQRRPYDAIAAPGPEHQRPGRAVRACLARSGRAARWPPACHRRPHRRRAGPD